MIVRDEEAFLPKCLASLKGVADEIVVVDTGSRDKTLQIARDYGAKIFETTWKGDFAQARNLALTHASSAWILYIDADEHIAAIDSAGFVEQLNNDQLGALTVKFRPATGKTRYREQRVFRNHPDVRFTGAIHETHLTQLDAYLKATGKLLAHSELALDHLGYDGPQDHKHVRNLPLLKQRVASTPEHIFSWVHLGATYAGMGEVGKAGQAWSQGLAQVRNKAHPLSRDCLPYLAMLHYREQEGLALDELLSEALSIFPDNLGLHWIDACQHVNQKCYAQAIEILLPLSKIDAKNYIEPVFSYDQRLFSVWAHEALGMCYFHLEQPVAATHHFHIVNQAEPSPEHRARYLLAKSRVLKQQRAQTFG